MRIRVSDNNAFHFEIIYLLGSLENLHQEPSNTLSSSKVAPLSPINSSPLANLHTSSSTEMNPGSQHSSTGMSPCSQNRKRQSANENTDCTTRKVYIINELLSKCNFQFIASKTNKTICTSISFRYICNSYSFIES